MEIFASSVNHVYENNLLLSTTTEAPKQPSSILTREQSNVFRLVNFVIVSSLVAVFGIFANAINMTVFYRQGFTTTTNISLFALAISDMMCLVTVEFYNVCLNPYLDTDDIPYIFKEMQHLFLAWWHICAGRITGWITVFITGERCLGVALPLKVKQIVTPRRTAITMCLIYAVNFFMVLPEYSIAYLGWKFVPSRNRTVFGLLYRSNTHNIYGLIYCLTSTSGIMSFVFVIILTAFLVINLKRKSKWRKQATGGSDNSSETISSRDKKAMKMIIMIACVLIVCYIPGTSVSLVSAFVPEFMIDRAYENSFFSFWSIAFVFSTINSSVNVFLYYRMSTKYRQTFDELFSSCLKTNRQPLVE